MELTIGVAKLGRFGKEESAETVDVIERPSGGGFTIIMSDGLVNRVESKAVSFFVVNKISSLITEGVRDSTAIRATSDQLFTNYGGTSQSLLNLISVDLVTDTIVISRNNPHLVYYYIRGDFHEWRNDSSPIGTAKHIQPSITEIPIENGAIIIVASDGVFKAGHLYGQEINLQMLVNAMVEDDNITDVQQIADFIINQALLLDQGQAQNDMSVMILRISDDRQTLVRRSNYLFPI